MVDTHDFLDPEDVPEPGSEPVTAVRRNYLKADREFEDRLRSRFDGVERSGWNPRVFRLPRAEKPGRTYMHWRLEYYVQEESAAVPVDVLDPQPGDSVLDLCAAPGGKTSQIAARLGNDGELVANDSSRDRLSSLQVNAYRTGAAAATTCRDGRNFAGRDRFDKVLVDAPCTGEGDRLRRGEGVADPENSKSLARLQYRLLEAAVRLVKPSGAAVYSTCTLSPYENEAVVERAIEETGMELCMPETGAPHDTGVKEFEGRDFDVEAGNLVRVTPRHLDSGVIFCARLE